MAGDHANKGGDKVKRRRQAFGRAATTRERAARAERETADTSELFGDPAVAEDHREAARRQEADADDERHNANRKR
jgi:hypothetical protein